VSGVIGMRKTKGTIFVLMPTYNHRQYLQSAVEGVMAQVVDTPVVLIIRDDASTDGTKELAEKLALRFPGRIELILNEKNLFQTSPGGITEMLREILLKGGRFAAKSWTGRLSARRNTFIALCEGDDYWTDPQKLQKQLSVFRANKAVRLVHHDVEIIVQPGGSRKYEESLRDHLQNFDSNFAQPNQYYFRDGHNIMTCSAMFRASAVEDVVFMGRPPGMAGDWILFALICGRTRPHFLETRMATYRIHGSSYWSSKGEKEQIESHMATKEYLNSILREGRIIRKAFRRSTTSLSKRVG
jgi:glycosyltransferase involved in cell wall biosynthesis